MQWKVISLYSCLLCFDKTHKKNQMMFKTEEKLLTSAIFGGLAEHTLFGFSFPPCSQISCFIAHYGTQSMWSTLCSVVYMLHSITLHRILQHTVWPWGSTLCSVVYILQISTVSDCKNLLKQGQLCNSQEGKKLFGFNIPHCSQAPSLFIADYSTQW